MTFCKSCIFPTTQKPIKVLKSYKVRPLFVHFNESFSSCLSKKATQNVNENMIKFKYGQVFNMLRIVFKTLVLLS